jgi:DNA-directed RNA polymerase specialized sigma24 family protein
MRHRAGDETAGALLVGDFRVLAFRAPEQAAIEFLFRSTRAAAGIALRFRLGWDVAEDIAQESYVIAIGDDHAALRRARHSTRLDSWIGGVLWRLATARWHSSLVHRRLLHDFALRRPQSVARQPLDARSFRAMLQQAPLTTAQRYVLVLMAHGQSVAAIAALAGVDRHTVDDRAERGITRMRLRSSPDSEVRSPKSPLQVGEFDALQG